MDNSKIISRFFIVKRLLKNIKVLSDNNIELILTYYWSFLPKKKVGKPLPQEILPTSREEKPDESYCRKFPNDPDCQKGTLEDI